jgi:hypothetical protein
MRRESVKLIMKVAQIAPLIESVPPRLYGGTERIVSFLTEEPVRLGHEVFFQLDKTIHVEQTVIHSRRIIYVHFASRTTHSLLVTPLSEHFQSTQLRASPGHNLKGGK